MWLPVYTSRTAFVHLFLDTYSPWCYCERNYFLHLALARSSLLCRGEQSLCVSLASCNLVGPPVSSKRLLVGNLECSVYKITSPANRDSFTSFPSCVPFISLSCLIALTRNSCMVSNGSSKSSQPCSTPFLREEAFTLRLMSHGAFGEALHQTVQVPSSSWLAVRFIVLGCQSFPNDFCVFRWSLVIFLYFIDAGYYINWFFDIKPNWSQYIIFSYIAGFCFLVFCSRFLCLYI